MQAPDHQKEARILSTPNELEKGLPLVEKKDTSRGRVIFSLGEMPIKEVYLTPLGNTLERVSHTEVMFRGNIKIMCDARSELLKDADRQKTLVGRLTSSSKDSGNPDDSEDTKKNIKEAERLAADSEAIMQRMLRKNEETKEIATNTMTRLQEQGEQMRRIQGNLDTMEGHFDQADHELKSINSVWGQLGNAIVGAPKKKYDTNSKQDKVEGKQRAEFDKQQAKEDKKREKKEKKAEKERAKRGAGATTQSALPEELSVLSPQAQQSVRNTDQMLDVLSGQLKDIKGMAVTMGNELEIQNERLDSINASSERVDARLKATNLKVKKQL